MQLYDNVLKIKDKVTELTRQRKSPPFFHMIQQIHSLTPSRSDVGKSELLQYFPSQPLF